MKHVHCAAAWKDLRFRVAEHGRYTDVQVVRVIGDGWFLFECLFKCSLTLALYKLLQHDLRPHHDCRVGLHGVWKVPDGKCPDSFTAIPPNQVVLAPKVVGAPHPSL